MKITFIGAGSLGFTRKLFSDLMSIAEFRTGTEVAFMDINPHNLEMVTTLCQRDLDANNIPIKIVSTTDRNLALKDAKYVFNCIRVGGLEAFETDIEIPLRYGVDQCVGDTICAGGIMYGQRVIAAMKDICESINAHARPDVLMLNYSNPNAMVTWACNHYFGVNTIGLCHGVIHGQQQIADAFGLKYEDLDIICTGINHQTWYLSVKHNGEDLTHRVLEVFEKHEHLSKTEKLRIDVMRRFGYYSTESNGHLSEYLMWYRKPKGEMEKWNDPEGWYGGETGGYLRVCREGRNWFETEYPKWLEEPPNNYTDIKRGVEHGSYIVEALELGHSYRGHFNVVNNGTITNLPDDCIIETPCYVDGNGVSVPKIGDLPMGCAAICSQSVWVQRLAVEAAIKGDVTLLKQAMMMDPLTGAVCTVGEIDAMVAVFLREQAQWLPQYK